MFNKIVILSALSLPLIAQAETAPDGDEIISLRYSEATTSNDTRSIWGVGFSHIRGEGEFGFTLSADFQNFDEDGAYIDGVGREKEEFRFYNIMGGLTYGVTEQFYVMPKVGFTFSKYTNFFADEKCSPLSGCTGENNFINEDKNEDYRISYGMDFMFLHNSVAYGLGITDFSYFGERETKINLNIGYRF
ncbi:Whole genome shotgun sequence [Vibrio owensii]|uniref:Whole genome shotgun sequence n=1 Tax=Vibrio owensii TaxID=696485 RepID=A0AAU9PYU3_9VIBR|nr:Whole genome shotgun sequence [Vibrio owensii]